MPEFKEQYERAKTWKDLDEVLTNNIKSKEEAKQLKDAMQTVRDTTGLDMRQDFMFGILKGMIRADMFGG